MIVKKEFDVGSRVTVLGKLTKKIDRSCMRADS